MGYGGHTAAMIYVPDTFTATANWTYVGSTLRYFAVKDGATNKIYLVRAANDEAATETIANGTVWTCTAVYGLAYLPTAGVVRI
jgi:hypothetical protein